MCLLALHTGIILKSLILFQSKVDGLIVSNTTISRADSLRSNHKNEVGGLSGEPLRITSTQLIADMYRYTDGNF